jgi:hypothetical protein
MRISWRKLLLTLAVLAVPMMASVVSPGSPAVGASTSGSNNTDTLILVQPAPYNSITDQNLFITDYGGELTWGAFAPCQLFAVAATFSNGTTDHFGPTSTGTTAPLGVGVSRVEAVGVNCTNTVGATGVSPIPDGGGYYVAYNNSDVYSYGDTSIPTSTSASPPHVVGIAEETAGNGEEGYLLVNQAGGVYATGALFYGSINGPLNAPIVGIAVTPDDQGYWMVASDGGVFAFGDAKYYGGMGGKHLNEPIVGMAVDDATGGYWLVASDGGVFSFNAPFYGSTGAITLNKPIVGMEAAPDGSGYRFVASDGGVFCFNLPFEGSLGGDPPSSPVVGMAASGTDGYWLVEHNGVSQAFGAAPTVAQDTTPPS